MGVTVKMKPASVILNRIIDDDVKIFTLSMARYKQ